MCDTVAENDLSYLVHILEVIIIIFKASTVPKLTTHHVIFSSLFVTKMYGALRTNLYQMAPRENKDFFNPY